MMDQLASIGIAFEEDTIDRIFKENVCYYFDQDQQSKPKSPSSKHKRREWAIPSIYDEHKPVRPWALGEIVQSETGIYHLAGSTTRTPGLYRRMDCETGQPTDEFLANTNERIHRSVRIRLSLEGLGYDDEGRYKCRALLKKGPWLLERLRMVSHDVDGYPEQSSEYRWGWVYDGPKEDAPPKLIMMEESLGPYERRLLHLNKGMITALLESSFPGTLLLFLLRYRMKYSKLIVPQAGNSTKRSSWSVEGDIPRIRTSGRLFGIFKSIKLYFRILYWDIIESTSRLLLDSVRQPDRSSIYQAYGLQFSRLSQWHLTAAQLSRLLFTPTSTESSN